MSLRWLKWFTILLPPAIIGSFEFMRHDVLLSYLTMNEGNVYITLLSFLLSYVVTTWMFRKIEGSNQTLASEQAKRAVFEERERMARDLHDNIAQMLFYLNVKLKQGSVEEASSTVAEIDQHLRQAIFNLRSEPEEQTSFTARVRAWIKEWSLLAGIEADMEIELPPSAFRPNEEILLFGIIQEAFTNIRKHSGANAVHMELLVKGSHWQLTIRDNGCGLPAIKHESNCYGLRLMKKRAEELNAMMRIQSGASTGTEIQFSGPLKEVASK